MQHLGVNFGGIWRFELFSLSGFIIFLLRKSGLIFSERELTFAICRRPSVCRLSVTFVHPTQAIEIFGNVSTPFGTLAIC